MNITENLFSAYLFILFKWDIFIFTEVASDITYEVNIEDSMIYRSTGFTMDQLVGILLNNYVGLLVSTILLCCNVFILQLLLTFNAGYYEWVCDVCFHSVYNKLIGLILSKNCVGIFLYSTYFNTWWFILEFKQKFNIRISLWEDNICIHWVHKKWS